ncbi:MAG: glycerol-3-phosphate 1-O-acyltransferase PlsY [Armatimonadota bacterium]|nr:glycerol-3-phosphate 1-O-acyltransferase PlsY [Armatimonadota bacterium]
MLYLALLLSYFCGAIPFGVLIGKMLGVDVRAVGSGNIGATNVWRALGPKAGATVFILDVLKGLAGPLIGHALLGPNDTVGIALCGIMAVIGHTYSVFLGFRGGKGVATSLGVAFGLVPWVALGCFAFWGLLLALVRMISVASVVACLAAPLAAWMIGAPTAYVAVAGLMALVTFIKHIPNMKRIMAGTEPKIGEKKKTASESVPPMDSLDQTVVQK